MDILTGKTPYGIFSYWRGDGIGNSIAGGEFWEPFLQPIFDCVKAGDVVVDVGANLGWFTIYAARRGAYVYAFEPCPEVFGLLKRNVEQNSLAHQVSLIPLALYSRCESMVASELGLENPANQVFVSGVLDTNCCSNSGSFALKEGVVGIARQYAIALDSLHLNPNLIKVDAEGLDLEVMQGAVETIRRSQPTLCYEYLGPDPEEEPGRFAAFNTFIADIGYEAREIHRGMNGHYLEFVAQRRAECDSA